MILRVSMMRFSEILPNVKSLPGLVIFVLSYLELIVLKVYVRGYRKFPHYSCAIIYTVTNKLKKTSDNLDGTTMSVVLKLLHAD